MGGPQPPTGWRRGLAYGGVSLLLGVTQGLGFNLVNNNLPWIQGSLGAYPNEAAWLSTAYTATNATIRQVQCFQATAVTNAISPNVNQAPREYVSRTQATANPNNPNRNKR